MDIKAKALIKIRHNEITYQKDTELILTQEEAEKLESYIKIIERKEIIKENEEAEQEDQKKFTKDELIEILVSEKGMDLKELKGKKIDELKKIYKEM